MSGLRRPSHAFTDAALTFLARTYIDFRSADTSAAGDGFGRIRQTNTALGSYDSRLATAEGTYFRMISVVEAYCDALSIEVLRDAFPFADRRLRELIIEHERTASTTWDARIKAMKTYHAVDLKDCPEWTNLNAGVTVRNAIAHGLGRLTPRQRNDFSTRRESIQSIRVEIVGDRLKVGVDGVEECLRYSRAFTRWIDLKVP